MTVPAPRVRFPFGLTPLESVPPWGRESALHWFGLTAGWYGLELGGHEVLRYSERTVRELRADGPGHRYVDYYVVRLWEDLIALVASALEPVPGDLAQAAAEMAPRWEWQETPEVEAAVDWHGAGFLYTGYLRVAPLVRCWRTTDDGGDLVTLAWEHRADPEGVVEFTGPPAGQVTLPTGEFLDAVADFDRALLDAMAARVAELAAAGPPPGVTLDLEQLHREHQDRTAWLPRARSHRRRTDWDAVRIGVRVLTAAAQE
jgi:hypothetical protein